MQLLHGCLWACHVRSIRLPAESDFCLSLLPFTLAFHSCLSLFPFALAFHSCLSLLPCPLPFSSGPLASTRWLVLFDAFPLQLLPCGFFSSDFHALAGAPLKACSTSLGHSSSFCSLVMLVWLVSSGSLTRRLRACPSSAFLLSYSHKGWSCMRHRSCVCTCFIISAVPIKSFSVQTAVIQTCRPTSPVVTLDQVEEAKISCYRKI